MKGIGSALIYYANCKSLEFKYLAAAKQIQASKHFPASAYGGGKMFQSLTSEIHKR